MRMLAATLRPLGYFAIWLALTVGASHLIGWALALEPEYSRINIDARVNALSK